MALLYCVERLALRRINARPSLCQFAGGMPQYRAGFTNNCFAQEPSIFPAKHPISAAFGQGFTKMLKMFKKTYNAFNNESISNYSRNIFDEFSGGIHFS